MKKTIYTVVMSIFLCALLLFAGCNKPEDFNFGDRKSISRSFRLQEVRLLNGERYESFAYDQNGRVSQVLLNGVDRFNLIYETQSSLVPIAFNNYSCQYDRDGRLVAVSGDALSQTVIEYRENRIDIIQQTRPITESPQAVRVDTLSFMLDARGVPLTARLQPEGVEYAISYDENPMPYSGIGKALLPLLMVSPLVNVLSESAGLLADKNVLRIYQTSSHVAAGVEQAMVLDYSYRFDHFLYDVPTALSVYGAKNEQYIFIYNE